DEVFGFLDFELETAVSSEPPRRPGTIKQGKASPGQKSPNPERAESAFAGSKQIRTSEPIKRRAPSDGDGNQLSGEKSWVETLMPALWALFGVAAATFLVVLLVFSLNRGQFSASRSDDLAASPGEQPKLAVGEPLTPEAIFAKAS